MQRTFDAAAAMLARVLDGAAGRMAQGDAVLRQRLLNEHRAIREAYAQALEGWVAEQSPSAGG